MVSTQDELSNLLDDSARPRYSFCMNNNNANGANNSYEKTTRSVTAKDTVTNSSLNAALTNAFSNFGEQFHENMKFWLKNLFERIGQKLDEHSERMNSIEDQLSKQESELAELREIIERGGVNNLNIVCENLSTQPNSSQNQNTSNDVITWSDFMKIQKQLKDFTAHRGRDEKKKRAKNLIIYGIDYKELENGKEDPFFTAADFFNTKLGIRIRTENVYRSGRATGGKPAPLFVTLEHEAEKGKIFKNCHKLKGLKISIQNDLSWEDREERRRLVTKLKGLKDQGLSAQLKGNQLFVDGEPYQE
jgi:hypothetical protein